MSGEWGAVLVLMGTVILLGIVFRSRDTQEKPKEQTFQDDEIPWEVCQAMMPPQECQEEPDQAPLPPRRRGLIATAWRRWMNNFVRLLSISAFARFVDTALGVLLGKIDVFIYLVNPIVSTLLLAGLTAACLSVGRGETPPFSIVISNVKPPSRMINLILSMFLLQGLTIVLFVPILLLARSLVVPLVGILLAAIAIAGLYLVMRLFPLDMVAICHPDYTMLGVVKTTWRLTRKKVRRILLIVVCVQMPLMLLMGWLLFSMAKEAQILAGFVRGALFTPFVSLIDAGLYEELSAADSAADQSGEDSEEEHRILD